MPATQSSDWGTPLLILLDDKTLFFFPRRNRWPFVVTMKIEPEFRWSELYKMNLLLKAEVPTFLMASPVYIKDVPEGKEGA